jgi:threonine dehydrogenase-like Zn-dependent dehydrogenase
LTPGRVLGHDGVGVITEVGTRIGRSRGANVRRAREARRAAIAGSLDVGKFASHHCKLGDILAAYDAFGRAAETKALKVVIERSAKGGKTACTERRFVS